MKIDGGFILLARKIFSNEIMDKPPLYIKLWVWMIGQANYKDRDKLLRGQFVTSIEEMRKAMSYKVGYRVVHPTKNEIRSAYEAFTKHTMITTTKTTRGMIITICSYSEYQNPKNYEAHNEAHNEEPTKHTVATHDTKEGKESKKEKKNKPFRVPSGPHQFFIAWWVMAFEKVTNQKPSITGRTGKQVQEMLDSVSLKHLICYSAIVLTSDDDFYQKAGRTLSVLQSQLDSFKSRRNEYDIEGWRELGLLPPAEIPIEDWKFWEPNND